MHVMSSGVMPANTEDDVALGRGAAADDALAFAPESLELGHELQTMGGHPNAELAIRLGAGEVGALFSSASVSSTIDARAARRLEALATVTRKLHAVRFGDLHIENFEARALAESN